MRPPDRTQHAELLRRVAAAVGPHAAVEGWATVELDRAAANVPNARVEPAPPDELLGATCRLLHLPAGERWLLLEPSTEGRLAASLARFGEGPVAAYLLADAGAADRIRSAGLTLSAAAAGPFGRQRLVLGGSRWGPHLLVADAERDDAAGDIAATIER